MFFPKVVITFFFLLLFTQMIIFGASFKEIPSQIKFSADNVEYWPEKPELVLQGSATIRSSDFIIKAEEIHFFPARETFLAKGTAELEFVPWIVRAPEIDGRGKDLVCARKLRLTSCDQSFPHYWIAARKIRLRLKRDVSSWGNLFLLDGLPVFYSPFFYRSLRPRRYSIEVEPGWDRQQGLTLRTRVGYPLTQYSRGRLYLDYYETEGIGKGLEYTYQHPDLYKGSFSSYHIRERTSKRERWRFQSQHWQQVNPYWTMQANLNFFSDENLSAGYFRNEWTRVQQEWNSSFAVSRASERGNFHLVGERWDRYDAVADRFRAELIRAPSLSASIYPRYFPGKIFYWDGNISFRNEYTRSVDDYRRIANGEFGLTKDWRLSRVLTFKPRLGFREEWQSASLDSLGDDSYISRYFLTTNLRQRLTPQVGVDYLYHFQERLEENRWHPDEAALDRGEEKNQAEVILSGYPGNIYWRLSSGYDFHRNRGEVVARPVEKMFPLRGEFSYTPTAGKEIFFMEEYSLSEGKTLNFQTEWRMRRNDREHFTLFFYYNSYQPDYLFLRPQLGFWLTSGWHLSGSVRSQVDIRSGEWTPTPKVTEKEVLIYRDLHCWETVLQIRNRPGVEEIMLKVNLKLSGEERRLSQEKSGEEEFYPWRQGTW